MQKFIGMLLLAIAPGIAEAGRSVPLFFFPNVGQADSSIHFIAETPEFRVAFQSDSVTFRIHGAPISVHFVGANAGVTIDGSGPLPGKANFLIGRSSKDWKQGIPTYARILYRGLYAGVEVTYGGSGRRLKSEFIVAPGADPSRILLDYEGADRVSIDTNGDLLVSSKSMELREEAPAIFQESPEGRVRVEGRYRLAGPRTVGFEIAVYDHSKPLVIDPVISYCTYLGGSSIGTVTSLAVDGSGNLYVAGWTEALNFPIMGAFQAVNRGGVDAFVVKLNAAGTALVYATYIGGRGDDRAAGIAVDSLGQVYVTGSTASADFPLTAAIRTTLGGGRDAFAFKLNATGNALVYSTYLGGSNYDAGTAIAVDTSGNAYIAGDTMSADFPVSNAAQGTFGGQVDTFVTKLTSAGALSFSTFVGGAGAEHSGGIAVDANGNSYVAGGTFSTNFPVATPIQPANHGGQDAFITKLNAAGSVFVYSTYLGGSGGNAGAPEQANAIAVDAGGNAYVAGVTNSINFPVTPGSFQISYNGLQDAFITKVNTAGSALVYSSYLGGTGFDWANGIAVDASGNASVAGYTSSVDFATVGGVQAGFNGLYDAFISTFNAAGAALTFSTYYGGTGADTANAIALDSGGAIYTGGQTSSSDLGLVAPIQTSNLGGSIGWLMRMGGSVLSNSGTAQFVKVDTATQGTWQGVYGSDGYNVIGLTASYPVYVTPTASGNTPWVWATNSTDVRALQEPGSSQRIAGTWYTTTQYIVDLPFTDSATHQMAVYCLDWSNYGRVEILQILDLNGNVLDSRTVSNFAAGTWVVWNLSGHVRLSVTMTAGTSATISGLFFEP